jgi:hypothetical protein
MLNPDEPLDREHLASFAVAINKKFLAEVFANREDIA